MRRRRLPAFALALLWAAGSVAGCAADGGGAGTTGGSAGPDGTAPRALGPASGSAVDATTTAPAAAPAGSGPAELVDATDAVGIAPLLTGVRGHAVATADVNGDGWADLFVGTFADREPASYRERGADGPAPDRLLLGSPSGFTLDETFDGRLGRSAGAFFDDLDGDGDPDLIVSRNVRAGERAAVPSEIYRNDGGRLVAWTTLDTRRGGRAVRTLDVDGDGWRDIVLAEDRWSGGSSAVFRNRQGEGFDELIGDAGLPPGVDGLGVAVGDLNGDGVDDLVFGGSNRWFLGTGSGFVEGASSPLPWERHGDEDDPAQVNLVDMDGDGRLDILLGQHFNSTLDQRRPEPIRLYLNREGTASGDPTFEDATIGAGLAPLATKSPQVLVADLDGDGQLDIVTTASTAGPGGARLPVVLAGAGAGERYAPPPGAVGPHYWIDAVILDANGDQRPDVFMVEWEPSASARLFLNVPSA